MNLLTKPAQGLMNQLKTAQKMALISLVFVTPVVIFVVILALQISQEVQTVKHEQEGLSYITSLRQLIQHVPEHRGMTNAYLNGNAAVRDKIMAKREQIQSDIAQIDQINQQFQQNLQVQTSWPGIKSQLHQVQQEAFDGPAAEVFARHSALIESLRGLMFEVSNQSHLTFDDQMETFFMINLVVERFPVVTDQLGIVRGMGSGLAAAGLVTHQQDSKLTGLTAQTMAQLKVVNRNLDAMSSASRALQTSMAGDVAAMNEKANGFLNLVKRELLRTGPVDVDSNNVFAQGTEAIGRVFALYDAMLPAIAERLAEHETELQAYLVSVVVGAVAAVLLALILFGGFYASIVSAVKAIQQETKRLASGDLTARVDLKSRDELGDIGTAFNETAASFSQVLKEFDQSNQLLLTAVTELNAVAQETGRGAEGQADQTEMVASSMNEMSSTVHEVARNAANTAEATGSARTKAIEGGRHINTMIGEISGLSGEVNRAADVVQTLDKDVDNISSVLEVIRGISEQTNLLALNAAIEAARAGEHGRGFAVVADEVRGLAGRTQEATEEIQTMIEGLQSVAQEASRVMKQNSETTQQTTKNASMAEEVLNGIIKAVEVIDDMSTQIASAAEEQSMVAEEINRNIFEIKSVVDNTAAGVTQTSARCADLESVANNLKMKIAQFKF